MARSSKKRTDNMDGISLGGGDFSVSIGSLLGREKPSDNGQTISEKEKNGVPKTNSTPLETPQTADKVILRRESAGRGGRTVTVVETRPPMNAGSADALAKAMRHDLGCGSHVEESKIILQGDIKGRVETWLAKQGVKKIVMGN